MAIRKSIETTDVFERRMDQVLETLQSLLILEGARAGMTKADVRAMVGVSDARVGKIWKKLKFEE